MPTYVMKTSRDEDFYVGWSTVVEAPVWYGPRAEVETEPDVTADRLDRADEYGTSVLWEVAGYSREGSWDDPSEIYMQLGTIRRERIRQLCALYEAGYGEDSLEVLRLLDPFEDDGGRLARRITTAEAKQ